MENEQTLGSVDLILASARLTPDLLLAEGKKKSISLSHYLCEFGVIRS